MKNSLASSWVPVFVGDARENPRAQISGITATYEAGPNQVVEGEVLDISAGGLFIKVATPLHVGRRMGVEIRIVNEPTPITAVGRVVWSRQAVAGDDRP